MSMKLMFTEHAIASHSIIFWFLLNIFMSSNSIYEIQAPVIVMVSKLVPSRECLCNAGFHWLFQYTSKSYQNLARYLDSIYGKSFFLQYLFFGSTLLYMIRVFCLCRWSQPADFFILYPFWDLNTMSCSLIVFCLLISFCGMTTEIHSLVKYRFMKNFRFYFPGKYIWS